jgi:hypothetical protein
MENLRELVNCKFAENHTCKSGPHGSHANLHCKLEPETYFPQHYLEFDQPGTIAPDQISNISNTKFLGAADFDVNNMLIMCY